MIGQQGQYGVTLRKVSDLGPVRADLGSRASTRPEDDEMAVVSYDAELRVWIDQDLCTGDGICTDHAPQVFAILEDGIAYCVEESEFGRRVFNDPGGSSELAIVPRELEAAVVHATAECPGECIFIEVVEKSAPRLAPQTTATG